MLINLQKMKTDVVMEVWIHTFLATEFLAMRLSVQRQALSALISKLHFLSAHRLSATWAHGSFILQHFKQKFLHRTTIFLNFRHRQYLSFLPV